MVNATRGIDDVEIARMLSDFVPRLFLVPFTYLMPIFVKELQITSSGCRADSAI